jgi:anti-anti-sigma regulatory factor
LRDIYRRRVVAAVGLGAGASWNRHTAAESSPHRRRKVRQVSDIRPGGCVTTPIVPRVQVVVTGSLNAVTLPRWQRLLDDALAAVPAHLVVDLTGCADVDQAGTALLAGVHERMWAIGGRLTLRGLNPRLDQIPPQAPTPAGYRPKHRVRRRGPAAPVAAVARQDVAISPTHVRKPVPSA